MKLKKNIILFLILFLVTIVLKAQPMQIAVDTLKFANFEDNKIYFDKDSSNLIHFFKKFNDVVMSGEGNVNMVHIGGSHVQAGVFPHRVRKDLLRTYPDLMARRGMIFPYSCAKKCNNPSDYKVAKEGEFSLIRNVYSELARPLGATGIAVYTSDTTVRIKINLNDPELRFETERVTILGFSDSGNVVPQIMIDTIAYEPVTRDSLLRRFTYQVPVFTDSFAVHINIVDSGDVFTLTGLFLDNDKPGITYHSLGVNGASVPSFLKCDYFTQDMQLIEPDLVIFGLGINDASGTNFDTLEFVNNYLLLIDKFKEINPDCAFIFITNNDSYKRVSRGKYTVNKRGPIVQEQFYKLADMTKSGVWDQFHIMGGLRSMDKWYQHKYAKVDRVHFTNAGYELLGDLFFNAFISAQLECYDQWIIDLINPSESTNSTNSIDEIESINSTNSIDTIE